MSSFEDKVIVQIMFNREVGERKAAAFAVHLQETIDAQSKNNKDFVEAYGKFYKNDLKLQVELATLRAQLASAEAERDALREAMQEAFDNCETCRGEHGARRCARCQTFERLIPTPPDAGEVAPSQIVNPDDKLTQNENHGG